MGACMVNAPIAVFPDFAGTPLSPQLFSSESCAVSLSMSTHQRRAGGTDLGSGRIPKSPPADGGEAVPVSRSPDDGV